MPPLPKPCVKLPKKPPNNYKKRKGFPMQFKIYPLDSDSPTEVEECLTLLQKVWEQLPDKDWFAIDDATLIRNRLAAKEALIFCAKEETGHKLAGFFMAILPGLSDENLGWDLGFPESKLLTCAHMDTVAILPDYRGYGLQTLLMQSAEDNLRQSGIQTLLCTVHPNNSYSLNNVIKQGYRVVKTTLKYGGLQRKILQKDL